MRRLPLLAVAFAVLVTGAPPAAALPTARGCIRASGGAGARCLAAYTSTIGACRSRADAACEAAARAPGGALEAILADPATPASAHCTEQTADALGYLGIDDLLFRIPEACTDFAEDLLGIGFADDPGGLSPAARECQGRVAVQLHALEARVVQAFGAGCYQRGYAAGCDRAQRDTAVARARKGAHRRIAAACGADFDALGLADGATLDARIDDVLDRVVDRARHYAERVYPPNNLGPTAEFGPYKVGVRTLNLVDPSRLNTAGTGPRPVTVEVYYPVLPVYAVGVPEDIVKVLGVNVVATPAFRDVPRAPGTFPFVLFSHGNGGIRFQSFFFAAHLASHGFIVASPDHHGNTFVDQLLGMVDAASAVNRPRDLSFMIDQFLAFDGEPGNFFEAAIDPDRIGVSGHSFGGYTSFAIAGGTFALGTFTDTRVKGILPQAPAASFFPDEFFPTITIPTLILGGSIDETTPFPVEQQHPFDELPAGAAIVGLAQLTGAGHFTFSDFCEVPRNLLSFLGGFDEACEPRHLPWRHAHDIVNYLSLNFFDAVLNGNPDALARLDPAVLATIEDLVYQSK
jgi:predicted dienelactone hydrolase